MSLYTAHEIELAALRFHHEGGKVRPARPVQGILVHLFLRTHFGTLQSTGAQSMTSQERTSAAHPAVVAVGSMYVSAQE